MDGGLANCEYACEIILRTSMRMHCRIDRSRILFMLMQGRPRSRINAPFDETLSAEFRVR